MQKSKMNYSVLGDFIAGQFQKPSSPNGEWINRGGNAEALDSAMGLPNRSTSALWILVFLILEEVSKNFMMSLLLSLLL